MHAPEFPFERDAGNVEQAIERNGLRYPVAQDNDFANWSAYGNQYWPAKYLIDARGRVRYVHFGEGEYDRTERAIRRCWRRRATDGSARWRRPGCARPHGVQTPESYLGAERAQRFLNGAIVNRARTTTGSRATRSRRCRRRTSPTRAAGGSTPRTPPRRGAGRAST